MADLRNGGPLEWWTQILASCSTNAQPLPAHSPATDNSSLIGCTSRNLTDDWSLASTHFIDRQYEFWCSFGCVLLSNQIYLTSVYDQSALEIRVRIRVGLEVALF